MGGRGSGALRNVQGVLRTTCGEGEDTLKRGSAEDAKGRPGILRVRCALRFMAAGGTRRPTRRHRSCQGGKSKTHSSPTVARGAKGSPVERFCNQKRDPQEDARKRSIPAPLLVTSEGPEASLGRGLLQVAQLESALHLPWRPLLEKVSFMVRQYRRVTLKIRLCKYE